MKKVREQWRMIPDIRLGPLQAHTYTCMHTHVHALTHMQECIYTHTYHQTIIGSVERKILR